MKYTKEQIGEIEDLKKSRNELGEKEITLIQKKEILMDFFRTKISTCGNLQVMLTWNKNQEEYEMKRTGLYQNLIRELIDDYLIEVEATMGEL